MTNGPPRLFFSLDEAATSLSVSRRTIYSLIDAGRLEAVKVLGRRLIAAEALQAFAESVKSKVAA
jgi:excisionase family DNA binding protein